MQISSDYGIPLHLVNKDRRNKDTSLRLVYYGTKHSETCPYQPPPDTKRQQYGCIRKVLLYGTAYSVLDNYNEVPLLVRECL